VQLTGPRFLPAPVSYTPAALPTYGNVAAASGPVSAAALTSVAPAGQCQTIGQVLAGIPEASQWLQLLKNAGLDAVLLSDPKVQATLFVPINSAFGAGIDAQPLRQEKTLQELLTAAPELTAPLAGYSGEHAWGPAACGAVCTRRRSFESCCAHAHLGIGCNCSISRPVAQCRAAARRLCAHRHDH
jgi:hypothetical protein